MEEKTIYPISVLEAHFCFKGTQNLSLHPQGSFDQNSKLKPGLLAFAVAQAEPLWGYSLTN